MARLDVLLLGLAAGALGLMAFASSGEEPAMSEPKADERQLVLGAGCFWCVEAIFEELRGVVRVESGYAGGRTKNPSYQEVCSGLTGHAEVVRIFYKPNEIDIEDLLRIFFTVHDPTTLNRQGPDVGTQYRSAIFYSSEEEKGIAKKVIAEVTEAKIWPDPIVTTLEPLTEFYRAESYHQDYYAAYENGSPDQRLKMNAGYCRAVIEPKVREFRKKYADRLKKKDS